MSIFEDKKIQPFCACAILKKGLEKRVLPLGIMGYFFSHDLYTRRKSLDKVSALYFFPPEIIQFDRTIRTGCIQYKMLFRSLIRGRSFS